MESVTIVKFFRDGFFGYSSQKDFYMGSIWHILPIVIMIIVIFLIYKYREKIKNYKNERAVRFILAFVMMIVGIICGAIGGIIGVNI